MKKTDFEQEVQRMTLGTLKTMNVQMGDLGEALKARSMADMFQATRDVGGLAPPRGRDRARRDRGRRRRRARVLRAPR